MWETWRTYTQTFLESQGIIKGVYKCCIFLILLMKWLTRYHCCDSTAKPLRPFCESCAVVMFFLQNLWMFFAQTLRCRKWRPHPTMELDVLPALFDVLDSPVALADFVDTAQDALPYLFLGQHWQLFRSGPKKVLVVAVHFLGKDGQFLDCERGCLLCVWTRTPLFLCHGSLKPSGKLPWPGGQALKTTALCATWDLWLLYTIVGISVPLCWQHHRSLTHLSHVLCLSRGDSAYITAQHAQWS